MRRRARVTYRPNRVISGIASVIGFIFVLMGLFIVIPRTGAVGVVWTLISAAIMLINGYAAMGRKSLGPEIHIEDEPPSGGEERGAAADRLAELQELHDRGLISPQEYEKKRGEIISEL